MIDLVIGRGSQTFSSANPLRRKIFTWSTPWEFKLNKQFTQKFKIAENLLSLRPEGVDQFSSEQIWRNVVTCSPVDPLQWMGTIKIQSADKNLKIIHMTAANL